MAVCECKMFVEKNRQTYSIEAWWAKAVLLCLGNGYTDS
jgi:hypothetical protein